MKNIVFLSGAAGTGKTHQLIAHIKSWTDANLLKDHQKVLAITRMHGSRRRLVDRFKTDCPKIRHEISTIDSFCFSIVNRARKALGIHRMIIPVEKNSPRKETKLGIQISLEEIQSLAVKVVSSKTYGSMVGHGFPLIAIDEFQDNSGYLLELIKCLASYSDLILAADHFQSLDGVSAATDWLDASVVEGKVCKIELLKNFRCSNSHVVEAAHSIRENTPLEAAKMPFSYAANYVMASWKLLSWKIEDGTHSIISPISGDLALLLKNAKQQVEKRRASGKSIPLLPRWAFSKSREEIKAGFIKVLLDYVERGSKPSQKIFVEAIRRLDEITRLMAIDRNSIEVVDFVASELSFRMNHSAERAHKYELLTVHSAKNREFENVVVFWPIKKMKKWTEEQQRRLLYNSITRARKRCEVLVLGSEAEIQKCPVLTLLGTAKALFSSESSNRKV